VDTSQLNLAPDERLTYVIPTHNRPKFLRRLLYFMSTMHEQSRILIVDSSKDDLHAENADAVHSFSNLKVTHDHYDLPMVTKCRTAMETIKTPYSVFCADDDFLMPEGVTSAIEFLERSEEYSCAQGIMVSLCTGKQNKCYALPVYSIEDENSLRRFRRFSSNWFSTFYSVHRTPILAEAYRITDNHSDDTRARIFPEILLSQLSVALGKVRFIPCVYNLREEHDLNESAVTEEVADLEACLELYSEFHEALASQLADASGATIDHARDLVDDYYGYLKDGGKQFAVKKKSLRFRVKREAIRHWRKLIDAFRRDAILQRRRLHPAEPMCRNEPWELAHRLMLDFPKGMPADCENKLPRAA
jgi:glycosyltransferase domain-containing protein